MSEPARPHTSIRTGCGSLDVTTAPGNGWTLDARNTAGRAPIVSPSSRSLAIESGGHDGEHLFDAGRDAWHLALSTSEIERLSLIAFAADARVDLPGLKALAEGSYVSFASAERAEELSGSVSGTILPFSFHPDLELVVDPGVLEHEEIFFNAARLDRSLALDTRDYRDHLLRVGARIHPVAAQPSRPEPAVDAEA